MHFARFLIHAFIPAIAALGVVRRLTCPSVDRSRLWVHASRIPFFATARHRLRRMRARVWLAVPVASHVSPSGVVCPRCCQAAGALSVLTARLAYYACDRCHHRWSTEPATRLMRLAA